ncbi:MAG: beta-glucosidase BglX, partial [Fimbriimonadaceae bacterium]|nr:beta-glucosidase BglX [Chitinophagales bacterium]
MKFAKLFSILSILFACSFSSNNTAPKNKEEFINDLINIMTLEEKIGQMVLFTSDWAVTGPSIRENYIDDIKSGKVGAIFNAYTAKYTRQLQQYAVENTRLHIPLLFGYDVIHGHKTIFPIPLGESCSWDLTAIERSARIAATEASADGINWTYAPMVDIGRDPRWGRVAEGAGEDTYLGSLIAAARVKGFQGNNNFKNNTSIIACAKHYAAYGAAQSGRDYNTVDMSENTLRDIYLPPFKACVDAGVKTFMTSFNELNGVPASGSSFLLKDILREEWGFKGFVVTDYTSINEMVNHGFASDEKNAGELAINAGVDMDMQGAVYYNYLKALTDEGKINITQIDKAVKNILEIKYDLGLFDDPYKYCDEERAAKDIMTKENLETARDIARKSMVLLKNENNILPLEKSGTIALIGPLADDQRNLIGNWSAAGDWKKSVSVLQGFKNAISDNATILYAKGANITDDKNLIKKLNDNGGDIIIDTRSPEQLIAEAMDVAKKSDVVVMVLGESQGMSGEAASRSDIGIPENQKKLLEAIHATGKPIVLLLMNGRPLTLSWEDENINAILETWFGGTESGNAIADIVFGDYNPSAKLTVTFPRTVGQIPIYYNYKNTGRPFDENSKYTSKYLDIANTPLYPFGYGLSYTTFAYTELKLNKNEFNFTDLITITVTIKNTGTRDGEEIVQLYIHDLVGSITRPVKELKGFNKIFLKAGESKT